MMGGKDRGTLPPIQDKYEKVESKVGQPMAQMPSTSQREESSHTMPSNRSTSKNSGKQLYKL